MNKPFALISDRYEGITKNAVNLLAGAINAKLGYAVLPVMTYEKMEVGLAESHTLLAVGCADTHPILKKYASLGTISVPKTAEGYAVYVGKDPENEEREIALIAGHDESGVLYGCSDFIGRYFGKLGCEGYQFETGFFDRLFDRGLPPYAVSEAPKIPTRAIWTWGHMIYDYRAFFKNMARLRLNEAVIWNDRCPINAADIVSYAHSYGIKIVWGYAWGWDNSSKLEKVVADSDDAMLGRIREGAIRTYETEYKGLGDGIYFQSFTEISKESVNGKSVAELVVRLVNDTASELLSRYPDLHIQFGLHATSVKTQTDIIAKTDPRVYIVWEDCGAFPYSYRSDDRGGMQYAYRDDLTVSFEDTLSLTQKLLTLRGKEERFGTVLKGLVCLDWSRFQHFKHPYVMGEHPHAFIARRTEEKRALWQNVTAGWLRNTDLARKTVQTIADMGHAPIAQMLVEDGCFEERIPLPVAIMAELFWNAEDEDNNATMEKVAKYPFVSI